MATLINMPCDKPNQEPGPTQRSRKKARVGVIAFPKPRVRRALTHDRILSILVLQRQYEDALAEARDDLRHGMPYETDLRLPLSK